MLKLPGLKSLVIVGTFEKLTCFDHLRLVLWWTLGLAMTVQTSFVTVVSGVCGRFLAYLILFISLYAHDLPLSFYLP